MAIALTPLQADMLPILWGAFPLPDDDASPWRELRAGEQGQDIDLLARLLLSGTMESMAAIRAARLLRRHGMPTAPVEPYGVLLVVPLEEWADLLAVYADGNVRYYNGSVQGGGVILETPPDDLTTALIAAADAALGALPATELPAPDVDLAAPTGVLFRSDGEHAAVLPGLPGGDAVLGAGAAVLQHVVGLQQGGA